LNLPKTDEAGLKKATDHKSDVAASLPDDILRGRCFILRRRDAIARERPRLQHLFKQRNALLDRRNNAQLHGPGSGGTGYAGLNEEIRTLGHTITHSEREVSLWKASIDRAQLKQRKLEEEYLARMARARMEHICDGHSTQSLAGLEADFFREDAGNAPSPPVVNKQLERKPGDLPSRQSSPSALHSDGSNAKYLAVLEQVWQAFNRTVANHGRHRESYDDRLAQHLNGENPRLPGWDQRWTQEEFDLAHLRVCMDWAGKVRRMQDHFREGIRRVKRRGFISFSAQGSQFPSTTGGYSANTNMQIAAGAPIGAIER